MENLTADDKAKLRLWQTEKTASGEFRRPWATPNNADLGAYLGAQHESTRSIEKTLEGADQHFAARSEIDPLVEKRAIKQYSNSARNAIIEAERSKENGNPNRQISKAEVEAKAREMYLAAHRRYGP